MNTFSSVEDAFQWWIDHVYKNLPPEKKKGRLKSAWRDFTYSKSISQKRMEEVLSEYGNIVVKTVVTYEMK